MEILFQLLFLALGFVMLVKGADWFVDGAAGIAARFGIPQLIIGLTIVAMGTSAPEAAVSIAAASKGTADITIGNILGSNILNVLVILGLSTVITPLLVAKSTAYCEIPFMIAISLLLLGLGLDGTISRMDGILLWAAFLLYLGYLFCITKKDKAAGQEVEEGPTQPVWRSLLWTVVGIVLIILGSNLAVDSACRIARALGMSERFIGLTIVALGTSLPELFTSVAAARRKNADIAIGNIVGSNVFNILFVVGTSSLIIPIPFSPAFYFDALVSIAAAAALFLCCVRRCRLYRWAGVILLLGYAAYFCYIL